MGDIIRTEMNTDLAVEIGFPAPVGTTWCAVLSVQGRISPQALLRHAFFRIDIVVNPLVSDALFHPIIDHPIAEQSRDPAVLDGGSQRADTTQDVVQHALR